MTDSACTRHEWRLSALLDGELTDRERATVGGHLVDCTHCRTELDTLRVTRALLRAAPVRALPSSVAAGMATGATGTPGLPAPGGARTPDHRPTSHRALTRVAAAAVAVSGLVGITAFAVGGDGPEGPPRQVAVPVDVYVADHLVRTTGRPVSTPVLLEVGR